MLIPVSLKEQLMPGTLEFAIQTHADERMDVSIFDEKYHNDETGQQAYDPRILLKVVLLGYSTGTDLVEEDRTGMPGLMGSTSQRSR
jgi:transposase